MVARQAQDMGELYRTRDSESWRSNSPSHLRSFDTFPMRSGSSSGTDMSAGDRLFAYRKQEDSDGQRGTMTTSGMPMSLDKSPSTPLPEERAVSQSDTGLKNSISGLPLRASPPVAAWQAASDRDRYYKSPDSSSTESHSATHNPASVESVTNLDASPSGSTSLETEKRRRIQQACKSCSSRRVKCDGQQPCQTCIKNGDECQYGQPKKRGPPKGTTRGARRSAAAEVHRNAGEPQGRSGHLPDRQRRASQSGSSTSSWISATQGVRLAPRHGELPYVGAHSMPTASSRVASHQERRDPHDARSRDYRPYEDEPCASSQVYRAGYEASGSPLVTGSLQQWQQQNLPHNTREQTFASNFEPAQARYSRYQDHGASSSEGRRMLATPEVAAQTRARSPPIRSRLYNSADIARFALDATRDDRDGQEMLNSGPSVRFEDGLRVDLHEPRVPHDTVTHLFEEYWHMIGLYWPLFPHSIFPTAQHLRQYTETRSPLLFNAICSIAAACATKGRNGAMSQTMGSSDLTTQQLSDIFYVRAYYYHISTLDRPRLETMAALVLLSLRESGAGHAANASHFVWLACRMVTDLAIARPGVVGRRLGWSPQEEEWGRRIYWIAYVFDKNIAVQYGRPSILRDVDASCPLPVFDEQENEFFWAQHERMASRFGDEGLQALRSSEPLTISAFLYRGFDLANIAEGIVALHMNERGKSTVIDNKYSQGSRVIALWRELQAWTQDCPENMRWQPGVFSLIYPVIIFQHIWGETCKILLHRPFILSPVEGAEGLNSHAEATKAAETVMAMFRDYERFAQLRKATAGMVYCLFTAGTILIGNLTSTDAAVAEQAHAQMCTIARHIRTIAETWSTAWRHLIILEKLGASMNVDLEGTGINGASLEVERMAKGSGSTFDFVTGTATSPTLLPGRRRAASTGVSFLDKPETFAGPERSMMTREEPALDSHDITAFWPDMPMGEDFLNWTSFTDVYLSVLGSTMSSSSPSMRAATGASASGLPRGSVYQALGATSDSGYHAGVAPHFPRPQTSL